MSGLNSLRALSVLVASALVLQCIFETAPARANTPDAGGTTSITTPVARLVLLGTEGGPTATKFRSEPANLLVVGGTLYLIDAGAGVSRQLAWAGYDPSQVSTIFITHHHIDHDAGLVSLMGLSWFGKSWGNLTKPPVQIYGPPATTFLVHTALEYLSVSERIFRAGVPTLQPAAPMFAAHDIEHDGLVYQDDNVRVTAVENTHFYFKSESPVSGVDRSYSYRFDTPSGSVVFSGDSGVSKPLTKLAEGADVLVTEICVDEMCGPGSQVAKSMPPEMGKQQEFHFLHEHLTPEEVGQMAAAAHVKAVLLTHLVSGLDNDDAMTDVSVYTAGVRKAYSGPVMVGRDLFEYDLVKPGSAAAK